MIGRCDVDPDDLVQNAYAKVLRGTPGDIRELGPYLRRTIVNLATDERRRSTRANGRAAPDRAAAERRPTPTRAISKTSCASNREVRALLYLVEIEGQPIADAAEVVGMSNSSARVALMRARRRLRAELTMEANGE